MTSRTNFANYFVVGWSPESCSTIWTGSSTRSPWPRGRNHIGQCTRRLAESLHAMPLGEVGCSLLLSRTHNESAKRWKPNMYFAFLFTRKDGNDEKIPKFFELVIFWNSDALSRKNHRTVFPFIWVWNFIWQYTFVEEEFRRNFFLNCLSKGSIRVQVRAKWTF